jgi:hypothetical protein
MTECGDVGEERMTNAPDEIKRLDGVEEELVEGSDVVELIEDRGE